MVRRGIESAVLIRLVAETEYQIANRNASIGDSVGVGMLKNVHQRDEAAMAPTDHAYAFGIKEAVRLEHPLAGLEHIVDFAPSVVDFVVHSLAVAAGPAIIGRDDGISLIDKLAHHVTELCR